MTTTEHLARLHALESQIAATADDMRAPLVAALERLVSDAERKGMDVGMDEDALDEDFFDNMPV